MFHAIEALADKNAGYRKGIACPLVALEQSILEVGYTVFRKKHPLAFSFISP